MGGQLFCIVGFTAYGYEGGNYINSIVQLCIGRIGEKCDGQAGPHTL